jgi:hypothetical protein
MIEKGILDQEIFTEEPIYDNIEDTEDIENTEDIDEDIEVQKPLYHISKNKPILSKKKVLSDSEIQSIVRNKISTSDFPDWLS